MMMMTQGGTVALTWRLRWGEGKPEVVLGVLEGSVGVLLEQGIDRILTA